MNLKETGDNDVTQIGLAEVNIWLWFYTYVLQSQMQHLFLSHISSWDVSAVQEYHLVHVNCAETVSLYMLLSHVWRWC
jgi:hypothetical protein